MLRCTDHSNNISFYLAVTYLQFPIQVSFTPTVTILTAGADHLFSFCGSEQEKMNQPAYQISLDSKFIVQTHKDTQIALSGLNNQIYTTKWN